MGEVKRGLLSCPWCPWEQEVEAPTIDEVVAKGNGIILQHNADVGHLVKPGAKPRATDRPRYRHGKPVQ